MWKLSSHRHPLFFQPYVTGKKKDARSCKGYGISLPFKISKKMKASTPAGQFFCRKCARLTKSKHYCGICKKIWNHLDSESWVRCDGSKVWVHAECDKISSNLFKNLGGTDYYCPTCKAKFNFELSDSEKGQPRIKVVCECGSCGTEKLALSEWERHTGSKARNWKTGVRVKGSMLPLEQERLVELRESTSLSQDEIFAMVIPNKSATFRGIGVIPKPSRTRAGLELAKLRTELDEYKAREKAKDDAYNLSLKKNEELEAMVKRMEGKLSILIELHEKRFDSLEKELGLSPGYFDTGN